MFVDRIDALNYLKNILPPNKALGLLAQIEFKRWINTQDDTIKNKFFNGCWIVALKDPCFYALRTCFFVSSNVLMDDEISDTINKFSTDRQFHALCSSLNRAGFDVIQCFPVSNIEPVKINSINWIFYRYNDESLEKLDDEKYFNKWVGRGRAASSKDRNWNHMVTRRFEELRENDINSLILPEVFFNNVFKKIYHASVMDPYDADAFLITYDGNFFPIELKEKFPFTQNPIGGILGIDAGRILMMLRLCLPTNSNGLYIVREVDETEERKFLKWKMIRLDEILMKCSWNLQGGGTGMGGGRTSTILVPYNDFSDMTSGSFKDTNLRLNAHLSENTRKLAESFYIKLNKRFYDVK